MLQTGWLWKICVLTEQDPHITLALAEVGCVLCVRKVLVVFSEQDPPLQAEEYFSGWQVSGERQTTRLLYYIMVSQLQQLQIFFHLVGHRVLPFLILGLFVEEGMIWHFLRTEVEHHCFSYFSNSSHCINGKGERGKGTEKGWNIVLKRREAEHIIQVCFWPLLNWPTLSSLCSTSYSWQWPPPPKDN